MHTLLSKDRSGLPGAVINRAETNTLRLALLYTLLDSSFEIGSSHLHSALALWD
ncbi:hypothetical protein [Halodesulfovibrio sp.]|uniref:hypothetical protein n=1 Tax=Halodesulfovibrio sp. TaxID=1912772 RepID=UPI0025FC9CD7|nr:hypothetical protein [Halodesulfovibrio sp.]MCT4534770.1 hypothetical protein [Halodesulfovibrio sp.]